MTHHSPHFRTGPRGRRAGYTMLELVVVLALTGMIAGLAMPRIDVARYKADAVVTGIRSTLQQAQRASLVAQYDVIVSFDLTGNRVRLVWDSNNDHNVSSGERVTWRSLAAGNRFAKPGTGVHGDVDDPIVGATTRMMDEMPTVTFHRDGSLSSDLEIYLSTTGHPSQWRAVTVVQATGRTDWFRLAGTGRWVGGAL